MFSTRILTEFEKCFIVLILLLLTLLVVLLSLTELDKLNQNSIGVTVTDKFIISFTTTNSLLCHLLSIPNNFSEEWSNQRPLKYQCTRCDNQTSNKNCLLINWNLVRSLYFVPFAHGILTPSDISALYRKVILEHHPGLS